MSPVENGIYFVSLDVGLRVHVGLLALGSGLDDVCKGWLLPL